MGRGGAGDCEWGGWVGLGGWGLGEAGREGRGGAHPRDAEGDGRGRGRGRGRRGRLLREAEEKRGPTRVRAREEGGGPQGPRGRRQREGWSFVGCGAELRARGARLRRRGLDVLHVAHDLGGRRGRGQRLGRGRRRRPRLDVLHPRVGLRRGRRRRRGQLGWGRPGRVLLLGRRRRREGRRRGGLGLPPVKRRRIDGG